LRRSGIVNESMLPWHSAEELLCNDEEELPREVEAEELPPGAFYVRIRQPTHVFKAPTRLHGDRGVVWRPDGENPATLGPMPAAARLKVTSDRQQERQHGASE